MRADPPADRSALERALLDFQQSPGRHAVRMREPRLLFDSVREILQLAAGRSGEGVSPAVRRAAVFFVRNALLYEGASHYALLGLERSADAAEIKSRYRLLMRLLHPDFTAGMSTVWPADAAARLNRANEVLSSAVQRRAYGEKLDEAAASSARAAASAPMSQAQQAQARRKLAVVAQEPVADPRLRLKRLAGAFGAMGGLALVVWAWASSGEGETLVKREPAQPPPVQTALGLPVETAIPVEEPAETVARTWPVERPEAVEPQSSAVLIEPSAPPSRPLAAVAPPPARPAVVTAVPPGPAVMPMPVAERPAPRPPEPPVPAQATAPALTVSPSQTVSLAAAPAPVMAPGLTMAEAHPLLARLLQQLESGASEGVLSLLDRDARSSPAAQALVRHYSGLIGGARDLKVAHVQFRAEPRDGRLRVTGHVTLQVVEAGSSSGKELAMQAEFASRDGAVVMTRLGLAPSERAQ